MLYIGVSDSPQDDALDTTPPGDQYFIVAELANEIKGSREVTESVLPGGNIRGGCHTPSQTIYTYRNVSTKYMWSNYEQFYDPP